MNLTIPYERQIYERSCGAAAIVMVYKSLELNCNQEDIWRNISRPDSRGVLFTKSCCICKHALKQGFSSIILKAKDNRIWHILELCDAKSIRVIFNHRLNLKDNLGHFTVFTKIVDNRCVELHDPQYGGHQCIREVILKELLRKRSNEDEITGNILITISRKNSDRTRCELCGANIPESIDCPWCSRRIFLNPREIIGCIEKECIERNWDKIICPHCDNSVFGHKPSDVIQPC